MASPKRFQCFKKKKKKITNAIEVEMSKTTFSILSFCALFGLCGGSVKKGIALWPGNTGCEDYKLFDNIAWWYDWRYDFTRYATMRSSCAGIDSFLDSYVPMVWGERFVNDHMNFPKHANTIMGFNEPNHHKQANMSAASAANLWSKIQQQSNGSVLVSPAASPCGSDCVSNHNHWFDDFFRLCKGCRVDYLATHFYTCNADRMMNFLKDLYTRYGKKIWLTEFSCPHTHSVQTELNYMKKILPQLEAADFVYRYAWFSTRILKGTFVTPASSLVERNASRFTDIGRYYNSFQGGPTAIVG